MPLKNRTESGEMKILKLLNTRMDLDQTSKQRYFNLTKGFEGEVMFDTLTAYLDTKFYILNDLQLISNDSDFQIDSLFITQNTIIPFEIKNFEGNYYFEKDNFYHYLTKEQITNPLHQLNRSKNLLHHLLQKNGFHFPIEGYLNFINPYFFLYQAPFNEKIIFPTQQQSLLKILASKPARLDEQHRRVANFLIQAHKPLSPYNKLPPYSYDKLRKGGTCKNCQSFFITVEGRIVICNTCGAIETLEDVVKRNVDELILLFPDLKINANTVIEWCKFEDHKRKIRRILLKNYKRIGHGKYTSYSID